MLSQQTQSEILLQDLGIKRSTSVLQQRDLNGAAQIWGGAMSTDQGLVMFGHVTLSVT